MKKKLLALLFVAGSSLYAQRYYAPPPPAPPYGYAPQRSPGPGYVFVDGYWDHNGRNYVWRPGYWARVPHAGARWVAPRYSNRNFYRGYWHR